MTARYIGLNASTGRQIEGLDHISQSIDKILTTPIGSRAMRRDVGSLIPDLLDRPLNGKTHMQVMAASVMAVRQWEPRVDLGTVGLEMGSAAGSLYLDLGVVPREGPSAGQITNLRIPLRG